MELELEVGDTVAITAGYYASFKGRIEARFPEREGYSVVVFNTGKRVAFIKATDLQKLY